MANLTYNPDNKRLKAWRHLMTVCCFLGSAGASDLLHAKDNLPIDIEADNLEHVEEAQEVTATGNVRMTKGPDLELQAEKAIYHADSKLIEAIGTGQLVNRKDKLQLQADRILFHSDTHQLEAFGNVKMTSDKDEYFGDKLSYNLDEHQGVMDNASMRLFNSGRVNAQGKPQYGRATSEVATLLDQDRMQMTKATFTNCDCDDPPWYIAAKEVTIDRSANAITAHQASMNLLGVPIAYAPWFEHPASKVRTSGLLTPSFRNSASTGFEVDIPYYWNIAPNQDATFTVHPTTKRGIMGKAEYRYLNTNMKGKLDNFSIYDTEMKQYRGLFLVDHAQLWDSWHLNGHVEHTETRNFLNDFNQHLFVGGSNYLNSEVSGSRLWSSNTAFTNFKVGGNMFQDLLAKNESNTWQQAPYLSFEDDRTLNDISRQLNLQSRIRMDNIFRLTGETVQRVDVAPVMRYREPLYIGSLSGAVGVRDTSYLINGNAFLSDPLKNQDQINRLASMASLRLDEKLDRTYHLESELFGLKGIQHTLEPTVQWVNNSSSDQKRIPLFDTAQREFSITNLFAENRYYGGDRINNGQWLSYGVNSRWMGMKAKDGSVQQLATFMIGQQWAPPKDRELQENHSFSDIVTGLDVNLADPWSLRSEARYNPYRGSVTYSDVSLNYKSPRDDNYSVSHHINHINNVEDMSWVSTIQLLKPKEPGVDGKWQWIQELDYSLRNNDVKYWQTGLLYTHDCWSLKTFVGNDLAQRTADHGGGWAGFLLTFRGLGEFGIKP